MRRHLKTFLLLCCFLLLGSGNFFVANAQVGTGGGCFGTEEDPDAPCPVDGGLAVLLVAGVAYGIKKTGTAKRNGSSKSELLP